MHRNLKPQNVFVSDHDSLLKLGDFGLARPVMPPATLDSSTTSPTRWTDYVQTRWYRAPELCGCFYSQYTSAIDVWAVGCIFAELLSGRPLFQGRDSVGQLALITNLLGSPPADDIARIPNAKARRFLRDMPHKPAVSLETAFPNTNIQAVDLLGHLLKFDPQLRPSAADALTHPYFHGGQLIHPGPDAPEPPSVASGGEFEFELRRLDRPEVRRLIYEEVLLYHPLVALAYSRAGRTACVGALTAIDGSNEMRRMFMELE